MTVFDEEVSAIIERHESEKAFEFDDYRTGVIDTLLLKLGQAHSRITELEQERALKIALKEED